VRRGRALLRRSWDAHGRRVDAARPEFAYPLEVVAFDADAYARLLPAGIRRPFARLGAGRALISRSSARVRRLGRGGVLELRGGRRLRVEGVVPDGVVRGAEVAVSVDEGRRLGVTNPRYALLAYRGDPARALRAVRRTRNAAGRSRVRDVGPAPWAVGGRVLPPALIKARFGEFAIAVSGTPSLSIDPAWVRRFVSTASVPILGRVTCHRKMIPALRRALGEIERRGLRRIVDANDYAGCFAPGTIAGGGISHHTWGLAVDLNAGANPYGEPSRQDPRLVRAMRRHGFAWGGSWPTPDAMHFEYRGR
jgi:D-alanyl-D-alanine carboxypeptidase